MAVAPDILCLVAEIRAGQAAQCDFDNVKRTHQTGL